MDDPEQCYCCYGRNNCDKEFCEPNSGDMNNDLPPDQLICPYSLNRETPLYCVDGHVWSFEGVDFIDKCRAWNEKLCKCNLIPQHIVLSTAGFKPME